MGFWYGCYWSPIMDRHLNHCYLLNVMAISPLFQLNILYITFPFAKKKSEWDSLTGWSLILEMGAIGPLSWTDYFTNVIFFTELRALSWNKKFCTHIFSLIWMTWRILILEMGPGPFALCQGQTILPNLSCSLS